MPSNLTKVRQLPNHDLFTLDVSNTFLKATLTPKAIQLGVRFDPVREDHLFDISKLFGDGNKLSNIRVEATNPEKRLLVADSQNAKSSNNKQVTYKLDKNLCLCEYVHPQAQEIYYKLSRRERRAVKRTLVLCFDGTSNQFSHLNTNVVKFVDLVKKDDPERQLIYYQPGVGTYISSDKSTFRGITTLADECFAVYLYQHVIDGYKYLVQSYRAGDRICIFGYSRGAYTARALAGMIHCVGLLPRDNIEHVPFAYKIYSSQPITSTDPSDIETPEELEQLTGEHMGALGYKSDADPSKADIKKITAEAYKRTFCISLKIDFVGVWDTVASVGKFVSKSLPFIDYNPSIITFRHALSLDEHRAKFAPSLWDHRRTIQQDDPKRDLFRQDVREVWFRGEHCNIGGGAPIPSTHSNSTSFSALRNIALQCIGKGAPTDSNSDSNSNSSPTPFSTLSNISLRWMVQQCFECNTGIVFDHDTMKTYRKYNVLEERPAPEIKDTTDVPYYQKLSEASVALDRIDVKHTPHDSFKARRFWYLLQVCSTSQGQKKVRFDKNKKPNIGRSRKVCYWSDKDEIYIHSSVVDHLKSPEGRNYVPRVKWYGLKQDQLPRIEVHSKANVQGEWDEASTKKMEPKMMDWNKPRKRDKIAEFISNGVVLLIGKPKGKLML